MKTNRSRTAFRNAKRYRRGRALMLFTSCLVGIILAGSSGCQTLNIPDKFPDKWSWKKDDKPVSVDHILAVWTEAVHTQTGKPAQRGFGGRLIFFDAQDQPLKVEGKLTVFVFDDQDESVDNPAAKYKFVFPPEVLPQHFSQSDLGPSYSVWIPLAEANAPTQPFSLVAKFEGVNGEAVVSSLTKKVMVGAGAQQKKRQAAADESKTEQGLPAKIQPVGYEESPPDERYDGVEQLRAIRTETIELTPSFSRRLANTPRDEQPAAAPDDQAGMTAIEPATPLAERRKPVAVPSDAQLVQPAGYSQPAETTSPNADHPIESAVHFERQKSLVPSGRSSQPNGLGPRREPHRAGWLSGLPPTPRSGFQMERTTTDRSTSELSRRAEQWFEAQAGSQESKVDQEDR